MPTPKELDRLLEVLPLRDKVPLGIAARAAAPKQDILTLDWPHVDFDLEQLALADSED